MKQQRNDVKGYKKFNNTAKDEADLFMSHVYDHAWHFMT